MSLIAYPSLLEDDALLAVADAGVRAVTRAGLGERRDLQHDSLSRALYK